MFQYERLALLRYAILYGLKWTKQTCLNTNVECFSFYSSSMARVEIGQQKFSQADNRVPALHQAYTYRPEARERPAGVLGRTRSQALLGRRHQGAGGPPHKKGTKIYNYFNVMGCAVQTVNLSAVHQ